MNDLERAQEDLNYFAENVVKKLHMRHMFFISGLFEGLMTSSVGNAKSNSPKQGIIIFEINKDIFRFIFDNLLYMNVTGIEINELDLEKIDRIFVMAFTDKEPMVVNIENYEEAVLENKDRLVIKSILPENMNKENYEEIINAIKPHLLNAYVLLQGKEEGYSFMFRPVIPDSPYHNLILTKYLGQLFKKSELERMSDVYSV